MQSFTSLPFKTKTASGFSHVNGMAKFSSAGVVLEFESKLLGLISAGVKEARLPIGEIRSVKFRKGLAKYGAKIEIRLNNFLMLKDVPSKDGKITLSIEKDDFETAREVVARLQEDLSEYATSLPPPRTSVASLIDGSEDDTEELK